MLEVVAMMLPGPYDIQDYEYDLRAMLSTKCPAGPMRAPMAICTWVTEGTLDAVARELDLDPVDVRRTNMIRPEQLPYVTATGERYEDITPTQTLVAALERVDVAAFRERQRHELGGERLLGLGIASVVEPTTYGSAFYRAAGIPGSGHESAWVKVEPSGSVNASVGIMASRQGYETTIAQAVAEGLGVEVDDVAVHLGDTLVAPYGMGSRGSRGATAGAGTALLAAGDLRRKVLRIAAGMLEIDVDSLDLARGRVLRRVGEGWQDAGIGLGDVARLAYLAPLLLPDGMEPGLEAHRAYDPPPMTYSNGTHVCQVAIDVATGEIEVGRYLVIEDAGTVLNPKLVEGQLHGAISMGLSGALLEEVRYDAEGHDLSGSFLDYMVQSIGEAVSVEVVEMGTPNRSTPGGIKGMSEGGVMGSIAALACAVGDALRPLGVAVDTLPLSPERVHALLRAD